MVKQWQIITQVYHWFTVDLQVCKLQVKQLVK